MNWGMRFHRILLIPTSPRLEGWVGKVVSWNSVLFFLHWARIYLYCDIWMGRMMTYRLFLRCGSIRWRSVVY